MIKKIKTTGKKFVRGCINVVELFLATDMPLYSANAAFFMITTAIPLFMLMFSAISHIPIVKIDDLIYNINLLFPNLPYVRQILEYIMQIARSLASTDIMSINIITALITGSTSLFSFTIGIRKVHDISHKSNILRLRFLSVINMLIYFVVLFIMFIAFILGSMIVSVTRIYLPIAADAIDHVLSFRYLVAFIMLFILMMSIYTTSTNFERKIRHNFPGAIITAFAWLITSNLFSIYFKLFPLNASVYGSLTGIVVVLLWLYICMNLVFLGATINEIIYPQAKIKEADRLALMRELEQGNDAAVDKILDQKYKLKKIKKFDRPNIESTDS